jgi:hypothetical protein
MPASARRTKAIGLQRYDVEKGAPARIQHALDKVRLVQVQGTVLDGGRQRGQEDGGPRIGFADADRAFAQEGGIGQGVDVAIAPVRRQVGFVPQLVHVDLVSVPASKAGGKGSPIVDLCRGSQWGALCCRRARPRRRAVEHGDQAQVVGGAGGDDGVPRRPVKGARLPLDLVPGKALPDPAKACLLDMGQDRVKLARIVLCQIGVDAELIQVRQGVRQGSEDPVRPGARLVPLPRGQAQAKDPGGQGRDQPDPGAAGSGQEAQEGLHRSSSVSAPRGA